MAVFFNTVLVKRLPMVESIFFFVHILGVLIFIPLWFLMPRSEGGSPITEFYNPNGWISNGVATWAGINAPTTALIGFDCSVHMGKLIEIFTFYTTFSNKFTYS
jgi:choline transport protein